jgi:hypothetical protein
MPRIIRPTAAATTRYRNLRLELITDRIKVRRAGFEGDTPAGVTRGSPSLILPR